MSCGDSGVSGEGSDAHSNRASGSLLEPGRVIRPMMSERLAAQLVSDLYGMDVMTVMELNSYDDRNFFVTVDEEKLKRSGANRFIRDVWPHGYVLKVLNSMDSLKQHVDAEHEAQRILYENGINCPQVVLNINGDSKSLQNIVYDLPPNDSAAATGSKGSGLHTVRLLTYIPGQLLVEVPYTPDLLYRVGQHVGLMEKTLEGYHHASLDVHQSIWNLDSVPLLLDFICAVKDPTDRILIEDIVRSFKEQVVPNRGLFQSGIIHGDFNEQNVLVRRTTAGQRQPSAASHNHTSNADNEATMTEVCGVLDFGDLSRSFYVYEVAIVIMYMMLDSKIVDTFDVGGHVLAGYLSERRLNGAEEEALRVCVAARYAQSLTIGAYTYSLNPTNDYLLCSARNGWSQLHEFWKRISEEELHRRWQTIIRSYSTKQYE